MIPGKLKGGQGDAGGGVCAPRWDLGLKRPRVADGAAGGGAPGFRPPPWLCFCCLGQQSAERTDLGVLCRPHGVLCAPSPAQGSRQSQGAKKNCHCPIINHSGEVKAKDHLSCWISNIHAVKIEREKSPFIYSLSSTPQASLPPWTFKPHFGLHR